MAKRETEKEEIMLFRKAMRDVKPLICDKVCLESSRPAPIPRQRRLEEAQIKQAMLSEDDNNVELETGEELLFIRPGTLHSEVHKLRRGHFSIQAVLDLHGMRTPTAYMAVRTFLHNCAIGNIRCVRIIHGKGYGSWQKQPVLKIKLNYWLRQYRLVLAFCSARPTDGGTGAVYVLLRKKR